MTFVPRGKDNPGEVFRAADQQQSVDNETALYAAVLGPGPVATGGIIRQFVKQIGIADNVATTVFTITTTDEAGSNDGGVYSIDFNGFAVHGRGPTLETSCMTIISRYARAINGAGSAGNNTLISGFTAAAASTAATKSIVSVATTILETSEYEVSVQFTIDLGGSTITTGEIYGMVKLVYAGFTTPPIITSAG